ncbi:hypothetical protein PV325_000773 [Microctonus aethiopoides]|uniref:Uncharacterized protein n=1 Tax=Microctonus aethiopoides TaxID=144406 RepID=A0AA39KTD0_9HYME|nr:hypothetical protein PV325_000773 [Microctonus aethiopoides]KAK0092618.1 hypothetical protein PV326_001020 [Microctonus aethiopoides]KAK0173034.1 hypothetical protein PV328_006288 [Microctonus aethiopoides]
MMMTPLMKLILLMTAAVSVIAAPHWENAVTDGTTLENSSNDETSHEENYSKRHLKKPHDTKEIKTIKEEFNPVNSQEFIKTQKFSKLSKKSRKHKNYFFNNPYISQINKYTNTLSSSLIKNPNDFIQEKSIGHRKKQQESNIFYVRLPPTPYYFVPGLGYISNPPTFSTSSLRPHNSQSIYSHHINSFINLPIDFVSNGKPTSVYQWENNNRKSGKRPNTTINKLKKGPYEFNGKPTSLYLLTSNGKATMHQPIRYNNINDNNIY